MAQMSELGAERDQATNENAELDERITDLGLRKTMVYYLLYFY